MLAPELKAHKRATVRFETRPGHQLQIDFGEVRVWIGEEQLRVHLFVATLGYSRRMHVRASLRERQVDWFEGMEGAFLRFGGEPAEILFDNARALVEHHDAATREVRFNGRLHAFARYWGFSPRACAPYRARTKGKDERGVGYVKRNAVAGRRFASWSAFEAHLEQWNREIADVRVHGTTGEPPIVRFATEAGGLRPLGDRAPFGQLRDLVRKVRPDCAIDLDTNSYSVPWRLVGETVQVVVLAGRIIVRHAGELVADHAVRRGRRQRVVDRAHLTGLVGGGTPRLEPTAPLPPPALLRPLAEYVETQLVPTLSTGDVVILDNLAAHKSPKAEAVIKARGAWMLFLPPYSLDLNPIEMAFAKLKILLRKQAVRTIDALRHAIGDICGLYSPTECQNYFKEAGYAPT